MGEGEHTHESETPVIVQQADSAVAPVVDHTIEHAERMTRMEDRMSKHEEDVFRRMDEMRAELGRAIEEGNQAAANRINEMLTRLESMATSTAETVEEPVEGGVEFIAPEVEESPASPEQEKRGRRAKRKARRKAAK